VWEEKTVKGAGRCDAVKPAWQVALRDLSSSDEGALFTIYELPAEGPLAVVTDGEEYAAALWTAPTFGCNQHESRQ
jgi:hypothetical protein